MLGNKDAVANVAVKNLDVATDFYRNTLGLKPVHLVAGEDGTVFSGAERLKREWTVWENGG